MPKQLKEKKLKLGRPKLPKGETKGKLVAVRFAAAELEQLYRAAETSNQTVSQWIRNMLNAATQG